MYNIIGGNEGFTFQIYPPHSGIVVTTLPLDYEIQDSYSLTIEAVDHGQPPLSSTCTLNIAVVDINDQRPKFPDPMPVNLSEGKCLLQTPNITGKVVCTIFGHVIFGLFLKQRVFMVLM